MSDPKIQYRDLWPADVSIAADAAFGRAWRRCEAALPDKWEMTVWVSPTGSGWFGAAAVPPYKSRIKRIAEDGPRSDGEVAALNALADKLEALRDAE